MTEQQRRTRLLGWLKDMEREITGLVMDEHVFWQIQDMFKNNETLRKTPSNINRWMASGFIQSTVVGIRRLIDSDDRSISFYRLLTELQKYPVLASRAYHLSLYHNGSIPAEFAVDVGNHTYDGIVGVGNDAPSTTQLQNDIDRLTATVQKVKKYVDKRIAHYDQAPFTVLPKFDDLTECLAVFEELIKKYKLLLTATSISKLLPTPQYDWKAVFRIPWLPAEPASGE